MLRTPVAEAVRENLESYVMSHQTSLKEVARKCEIGYSGLHRFMANDQANISSDTIDKIAMGLGLSPAWIVDSKPTVMDDVSLTTVAAINDLLVLWGKALYAGRAGYERMRPYFADDYICTGFADDSCHVMMLADLIELTTKKKDGWHSQGVNAEVEYKLNYTVSQKTLFQPVNALITDQRTILVSHVSYHHFPEGYSRVEGASLLRIGQDVRDIVSTAITPTITQHHWVTGAGSVTYTHGNVGAIGNSPLPNSGGSAAGGANRTGISQGLG